MMDYTDRHCRYLLRLLSKHVHLYTEMVTTGALLHGDQKRHLQFNVCEHPVALQLGGSDPKALAQCTAFATQWGYDEINLNVGCPSDRVQSGQFGACLMKQPQWVADCVAAMRTVTDKPVTVKTRLGVDDYDGYDFAKQFVETVAAAGCRIFIIHARKAWLQGLSPKANRTIPPLHYDRVYRLKQDFPELTIIINGGINTLDAITAHLQQTDGVMIGRAAYHHLYWIAECAQQLLGEHTAGLPTRWQILEAYVAYMKNQVEQGVPLSAMLRHVLGLFHGAPQAKRWRRLLVENARQHPYDILYNLNSLNA